MKHPTNARVIIAFVTAGVCADAVMFLLPSTGDQHVGIPTLELHPLVSRLLVWTFLGSIFATAFLVAGVLCLGLRILKIRKDINSYSAARSVIMLALSFPVGMSLGWTFASAVPDTDVPKLAPLTFFVTFSGIALMAAMSIRLLNGKWPRRVLSHTALLGLVGPLLWQIVHEDARDEPLLPLLVVLVQAPFLGAFLGHWLADGARGQAVLRGASTSQVNG